MSSDSIRKRHYRNLADILWLRIREFRDYVLEIEKKFENDIQKLNKQCQKELEEEPADDEDASYIAEMYGAELHAIEKVFLRTFRYSVLVSVYSFLESSMSSMCRRLRQMKKFSLGVEDIKGGGIERNQIYLVKLCGIEFPEESKEWQEIKKLNRIRNCIVHANGNVTQVRDKTKLLNIVASTNWVSLENNRYLIIDRQYIESAICWVEKFILDLHEKAFK